MPFGYSETDQGEWCIYGQDHDGKTIRFRIRRIPPSKEFEIESRYRRKSEVRSKRGVEGVAFDLNMDINRSIAIDKAVYAVTEAENCAFSVPAEAVAKFAQAMGQSVEPGVVVLDNVWGKRDERQRYPVKELFFDTELDVATWAVGKADKQGIQRAEEEEALKDASSPS